MSLAAEVANDYLAMRGAQARLAIAEAQFAAAQAKLAFVQARGRHGFVTTLELSQQAQQTAAGSAARMPVLR